MSLSTVTFSRALSETERQRRHLLLGNGFSIAAHKGFQYQSLVQEARKLDASVQALIDAGIDFEAAMVGESPEHVARLKRVFIKTVAEIHPKRNDILTVSQRQCCGDFLLKFLRRGPKRGIVFTTNYDLMLYWVLVDQKGKLSYTPDGFERNLTWRGDLQHNARVFYLHGGMHLYRAAPEGPGQNSKEITKLTSGPTSDLVTRVRNQVERGNFPMFVSEGSHRDKCNRIDANLYLAKAAERFREVCSRASDALFIYGHGLGKVDTHLIRWIAEGSIRTVYVGWFSDNDLERVSMLADWWGQRRAPEYPIDVRAFDVRTAPVWGGVAT